MVFTKIQTKMRDQALKEIIDTIKAYPKEYLSFKKKMDQILENLDKLKEII